MSNRYISPRAKNVWKQLIDWYGAATIVDRYGKDPPPDWAKIVDDITNDQVKTGMSVVRTKHVQFPPTLPEFEIAMRPPRVVHAGPTAQERLRDYVVRKYASYLTPKQMRGPWTYLGANGAVTGVIVPEDADSPSLRVMLIDMHTEPA